MCDPCQKNFITSFPPNGHPKLKVHPSVHLANFGLFAKRILITLVVLLKMKNYYEDFHNLGLGPQIEYIKPSTVKISSRYQLGINFVSTMYMCCDTDLESGVSLVFTVIPTHVGCQLKI